jgi:hypothetical protein
LHDLCLIAIRSKPHGLFAANRSAVHSAKQGRNAVAFAGINYLAVIIAAVVAWLVSAGWYMTLGRVYQAELGRTPEQAKEAMKRPSAFLPFIYALLANIIIAWMLAGMLGHLGPGQVTLQNGVISAAFLWFGFIFTTLFVNYSFHGRSMRLILIDLGNWLLVLLAMGAIVGGMGV